MVEIKRTNREERTSLLRDVIRLLGTGEMTRERLNKIEDQKVAPGCTVGQLIESSLKLGSLVWEKERVVHVSKHEIELDYKNEIKLRNKAMKAGLTPKELMMTFIEEKLKE